MQITSYLTELTGLPASVLFAPSNPLVRLSETGGSFSVDLWDVAGVARPTPAQLATAWTAPEPTPALAPLAAALLPDTDTTMHRISEAVSLGLNAWTNADVMAWVTYRRELRAVANGSSVATALPTKPAFPVGT